MNETRKNIITPSFLLVFFSTYTCQKIGTGVIESSGDKKLTKNPTLFCTLSLTLLLT